MIIKNIAAIIKSADLMSAVTDGYGTMWIGDNCSLYPLWGLPVMDNEQLYTLLDIDDKKAEKLTAVPFYEVNFEDVDRDELLIERYPLLLSGHMAFHTSRGAAFVESRYMRPLYDLKGEVTYWQRVNKQGMLYIAVKVGLLLRAILLPNGYQCNPVMLDGLQRLTRDVECAIEYQKLREAVGGEQMELGDESDEP